MRILVVSNLYPPHHVGGYELRCSQVAEWLHHAGHEVRVITSSYRLPLGSNGDRSDGDREIGSVSVERFLRHNRLEPLQPGRISNLKIIRRQLADAGRFIKVLTEFRPDVVNWWNMEGLTKAILSIPAARGIPDVHSVDDTWMIKECGAKGEIDHPLWFEFWQVHWGPRLVRPLVRRCLARLESKTQRQGIPTRRSAKPPTHVCFISEFRRFEHDRAGLKFPSAEVIYGGVSAERFHAPRTAADFETGPLRLLYVGHIDPKRGLHTVIEALGLLSEDQRDQIQLSVAYTGPQKPTKYLEDIHESVRRLQLSDRVRFLGRIHHDEMPAVYAGHHVLVFPSTLAEGLPMAMMEAMCAGCAVITTGSGGAIEIAERAELPLFPKEHPFALSGLIGKLLKDRKWVGKLAGRGQNVVLTEFNYDRMMEQTYGSLQTACRTWHTAFVTDQSTVLARFAEVNAHSAR